MSKIVQILCPSCGNTIKSDCIHGSIVYCKGCHSYKVISGSGNMLQTVFYKIYHHPTKGLDTNKQLFDFFANIGDCKIFDKLEVELPIRRYYLPVREIYNNGRRFHISLNEIDSQFLDPFITDGVLDGTIVGSIINRREEADLISTDFKPIYIPKPVDKTTFLPIDVDMRKLDTLYGVDNKELTIVKYLPISVLDTNMGTVISSGSTILNREQIIANVNESIEMHKKSRRKFRDILSIAGNLSIGIIILLFIYKILTIGISFFGAIKAIFAAIMLFLIGIWCIIWLGLYFVGAAILFAPIILLAFFAINMFDTQKEVSGQKPDMKKGERIFNLI